MSLFSTFLGLYNCPVCGYEAENEAELTNHIETNAGDKKHDEYRLDPEDKEILKEGIN